MADRPLIETPLTRAELNEALVAAESLRALSDFLGRALPQLVRAQVRAERAEASCERLRAERNAASSPADLVKLADELDEDNQATAAKTVRAAATTIERLRAALLWYAWPDRYVPRFEGVGAVGQGPACWSQMDRDIGAAARKALGDAPEDYARQAERVEHLIHDAAAGVTRVDTLTQKIRDAIESGSPIPVVIEERAAWARLVEATETRWSEDFQGGAQIAYLNEIEAAEEDLRDLGVDLNALFAGTRVRPFNRAPRRDAAWARLVKAERDVAMENAPCPSAETLAEQSAARQALRDLGVDVGALLGDGR